jgi:hypothetical protein
MPRAYLDRLGTSVVAHRRFACDVARVLLELRVIDDRIKLAQPRR